MLPVPVSSDSERGELVVDDAARERLGRLPKKHRAGAAQYKKPDPVGGPVDENAQQPEESLAVLHLVDDDEAVERFERELGVRETCLVGRILQVEKRDPTRLASCQAAGQSRLAHLPSAHEPDYGELAQESAQVRLVPGSVNHGCKRENQNCNFRFSRSCDDLRS